MTQEFDFGAPEGNWNQSASNADLDGLFETDTGTERLMGMLRDPSIQDIRINAADRVFFTNATGSKMLGERIFGSKEHYCRAINALMALTDVGYTDVASAQTTFIEGSFRSDRTDVKGSIFITTGELTRGEPAVVIRKQPTGLVTLDQMLDQQMMSADMRLFLELAVRGRLNIVLAGGSGAGKTTMARALSWFIDPNQRVITVEEVDELHLDDRLPNVVSLTTFREAAEDGSVRRHDDLEDLVRHALRMRGDRIWVGETRGKEAYALVKACLSGHDGSVTTVHANDGAQAVRQLVSYVMESDMTEDVARDQVAGAFHLAVHVSRVQLGRRVITEIVELEPTREGNEQRRNVLWKYDHDSESFIRTGLPSIRLRQAMGRHNVNLSEFDELIDSSRWG